MRRPALAFLVALLVTHPAGAQAPAEADYRALATHGDFVVRDFAFHTGERLAELRQHYVTWGTPKRETGGDVTNAVLLLHGTLGEGVGWGRPVAGYSVHPLLGPGSPLDARQYFVIAPDTIGSGRSSRPSDGLRTKFRATPSRTSSRPNACSWSTSA